MKSLLLRQIIVMSKRTIYGFILQCALFGAIIAGDLNAQDLDKSIQDIYVTINVKNVPLKQVFNKIEHKTGFAFAYNSQVVNLNRKVSLNFNNADLASVLMQISKESNLKFKRINGYIHIGNRGKTESIQIEESINEQEITITGRVTSSEDNEGLPGVNVIVKGTTLGTVSDVEGNYSLEVPDENTILVFSSVGYVKEEISVGTQSVIDLTMVADLTALDEIVVVGYGTARRKDISGAVSTIRLEDSNVALSPTTNALQSLQGTIAGVNVGTQNSPGTTPDILIRGQNSINGSNDPLIVLDGIIYLGSVSDINPDDIAIIDVLKDASAAAIYGSRSANGVIVITTKSGKTNKPTIRYDGSAGVSKWQNKFDMMNLERWTEKYVAQTPSINSPSEIVFDDVTRTRLFAQGVDTDWMDLISRNGFFQNHQVAVSGKSDKINYYFSGGYNSTEGAIVGDDYQRISVRSNWMRM